MGNGPSSVVTEFYSLPSRSAACINFMGEFQISWLQERPEGFVEKI
jgi:hypothetical protein